MPKRPRSHWPISTKHLNIINWSSIRVKLSATLKSSPQYPPRHRILTWGAIRAVISLGLLLAVLQRIDLKSVMQVARSAEIGWLLCALMLAAAGRLFAAYRWYLLLQGKNSEATFGRVLKLVFISSLLGMFMPGQIGVEALRVYGMSKTTSDSALAVSSVLLERVLAISVLTLLVIVSLWLAPVALPPQVSIAVWIWFLLLTLMIILLMHPAPRSLFERLLKGRFLATMRTRLQNFYRSLDTYKNEPKLLAISLLAAVVSMAFRISPTILIAWALDVDIPLIYFVIFLPIIHFVVQVPISLGGLGVRETSFVYFLGLVGVSSEKAFTLSIVVYAVTLITVLPAAWFYAREGLISKSAGTVRSTSSVKKDRPGATKFK